MISPTLFSDLVSISLLFLSLVIFGPIRIVMNAISDVAHAAGL